LVVPPNNWDSKLKAPIVAGVTAVGAGVCAYALKVFIVNTVMGDISYELQRASGLKAAMFVAVFTFVLVYGKMRQGSS